MHAEIKRLKALTIKQGADFSQAAHYFLDHLVENPQFLRESQVLKGKTVFYTRLLRPVAEHFHVELSANALLLRRLKKHRFIHGAGLLTSNQSLVFYFFEEIQTGLAIVSSLGGAIDFFRLTLFSTKKPIVLGTALPASPAVH